MLIWLKRWAGFLLFATGGLVTWLVLRKRGASPAAIVSELRAVQAEVRVAKAREERGLHAALATIEKDHAAELRALDAAEKLKADELRKDPAALAGFLLRAARDKKRPS